MMAASRDRPPGFLNRPDLRVVSEPREQRPAVPSVVLAMLLFVGVETMLFSGFISALAIGRATLGENWPPEGQPRFPLETTAFNTLVLLASGVAVRYSGRWAEEGRSDVAYRALVGAFAGGLFFVGFQGVEWVRLLREGLSFSGSPYGGFFYLIVGSHALHALCGLVGLGWMVRELGRGTLARETFQAGRLFWYFVVLLWPILYWRVYL